MSESYDLNSLPDQKPSDMYLLKARETGKIPASLGAANNRYSANMDDEDSEE